MNGFVAWIYQIALLLAATFAFLVIFQYGPANFGQHATQEMAWLKSLVTRKASNSAPAS